MELERNKVSRRIRMRKALIDVLILMIILLVMVLAHEAAINDCEETIKECNAYIKENCTGITLDKEKNNSFMKYKINSSLIKEEK